MDEFFERVLVRAATIDEILSDDFEALPGQKDDADLAARRLADWCRSCASGDWSLFDRRLNRDGWSIGRVLARFATVRRKASAPAPAWLDDAVWIETAVQGPSRAPDAAAAPTPAEPCPFEDLLLPIVDQADARLGAAVGAPALENFTASGRFCLRHALLKSLSGLCAPALYALFGKARQAGTIAADAADEGPQSAQRQYDRFVADMKAGGFRRLFDDKPILLRLMAVTTRQWIDATNEFVTRLAADLAAIRRQLLGRSSGSKVAHIADELSDPHNGGHSVLIVSFEDGARVVYKPKDLRLDGAWHDLIERLNRADPPVQLKAARAIARDGYGWTEFVDHVGCADAAGFKLFFQRSGAWLVLFHCFAGTDMHQENIIAAGDHPVPIDLEMILQATAEEHKAHEPEGKAIEEAGDIVGNSVLRVGLLPSYLRSPKNNVFAIGGLIGDWNAKTKLAWNDVNTDKMRPAKAQEVSDSVPNLPHIDGRYASLGDHMDAFIDGFADYARFLLRWNGTAKPGELFDGFAGLPVRRIVRPTRFYYMLLQRLKNHQVMGDGVAWSAQADFLARLADWEQETDPIWLLQRAERSALIAANVPYFMTPADGGEIRDHTGTCVRTEAVAGLDRARERVQTFDEQEIAWQIEVIHQSLSAVPSSSEPAPAAATLVRSETAVAPNKEFFIAETDRIAAELAANAIRRGPGAAWIGLDWLGDSEVFQLVPLGSDLYNGNAGIGVFLAAHAAVTGHEPSAELAHAAVAYLRRSLHSRNAARIARSLGTGGASGLGSIVYAFAVMAKSLGDQALLADAHSAAKLFTDDLMAADTQLDFIAGNAGAILGLLRLYRDTESGDALRLATRCGEQLLTHPRLGPPGRRSWIGQGIGSDPLNGMSHGASGFAYALASLAAATNREDFALAAAECIAFEDSHYDPERHNWPDRRLESAAWPCQWCHGALGIGLARIAIGKQRGAASNAHGKLDGKRMVADIENALQVAEDRWPGHVDTLCCGTLGSVEFFCEAADALNRDDLRDLASRRLRAIMESATLAGDYRWNAGKRQFNLGLFRGLSGVGYTLLRRVDPSLPNVLILE